MVKNKWFRQAQLFLLFLSGVLLVYLSFRKLNIQELYRILNQGDYWIALPVFIISLSGYYFRILRWRLLYIAMGDKPARSSLYASLCIGYAVNFAVPRLGEVSRCMIIRQTDGISFERSIISVIAERTIDTITLLLLVLVATAYNMHESRSFLTDQVLLPVYDKIRYLPWLAIATGFILFLALLVFVFRYLRTHQTISAVLNEGTQSVRNMLKLQHKMLFLLYTLLIWFCYFLMTYLWFYTFEESRMLGINEAFVIMAVGSIGRSVPIQGGGMGAYHYLVSHAVALFGVSLLTGNALALVIHGAQALLTITIGIIAWIWLLMKIKSRRSQIFTQGF